jgi:c-di-GMP-related signal transduction protein
MGSQAQAAFAEKLVPSVARQPILGANEKVLGYELLFRHGPEDVNLITSDVESITCAIIDTLNVIGLGVLCDGHRAFIDCTHQMLLMEYFALLPANVAVEIQNSVPAEEGVIAVCQRLKEGGYMIALDDFVPNDFREALVAYADFIKVDMKKVSAADSAALVARYGGKNRHMLAQRVETREDFVAAKRGGYTEFQGYFFRNNEHLRARQIPASQATYLRLLKAISKPEVDFVEVEDLVKRDPALCYRLLRYLNSPFAGRGRPGAIDSARFESAGRAGADPVDAHGYGHAYRAGKIFRPGFVIAGAGTLLRAHRPESGARKIRSVPDGAAFVDGRHSGSAHARRDSRFTFGSRHQGAAAL